MRAHPGDVGGPFFETMSVGFQAPAGDQGIHDRW